MKYKVELARLVRQVRLVEVEAESAADIDLKELYEKDDGMEMDEDHIDGWEMDADWGCEEGTHVVLDA
jgi:hypothetical protein